MITEHADQDLRAVFTRVESTGPDAFEDFYRHLADVVYGNVRLVVEDQKVAGQVTEQVLVDLWFRAEHHHVPDHGLMPWVITLTRKAAVRTLRATGRTAKGVRRDVTSLARAGFTHTEIASMLGLSADETLSRLRHGLLSRASSAGR